MSVLRRFDDAECRAWFAAAVAIRAFADRRFAHAPMRDDDGAERTARAQFACDARLAPRTS